VDTVNEGWVKVHRKLLDNPIFKDSESVHLMIYSILKANHEDKDILWNGKRIVVRRGQFISGLRKIAKETGISIKKIRSRSQLFENLKIWHTQKAHTHSLITICNYEKYQGSAFDDGTPKGHSKGTPRATNKNYKNINTLYVEGSSEFRLAKLLLEEIRKNKPDYKEPNMQAWTRDIDLMIRRDGRNPEQIRRAILWAQGDSFWWKNVLSPSKLRKQFDRLEAEMESKKSKIQTPKIPEVSYPDFADGGAV
jgi:hypothetical protein